MVRKVIALALLTATIFGRAFAIPSPQPRANDGPTPTRDCLAQHKPNFSSADEAIADECYKATVEFIKRPGSNPIQDIAGLFALVPICGLGALEITIGAATCVTTSALSLFGKVVDNLPNYEHYPFVTIDNDPAPTPAPAKASP